MSLVVEQLSAAYGKTPVIKGIGFKVESGELIGLIGPNGSGKSALLKTLAGLIKPVSGQVLWQDENVHTMTARARAKTISWLDQNREVGWNLSVREVVALGRAPWRGALGRLSRADEAAIEQALELAQCQDLHARGFSELSGGEQARVLLARALAVDAGLILADEPVAALDPAYQLMGLQILQAQARRGKTVIVSLHNLALARQFCSRLLVMDKGQLVAGGPGKTALSDDILESVFGIRYRNGEMLNA